MKKQKLYVVKSAHARKRSPGRPPLLVIPDPIPDTPEAIARACMQGPPKEDWDYLKPGSGARVVRGSEDDE